ncbi:MAG: macro domain-containing protein, partial [Aureliella sp.]
ILVRYGNQMQEFLHEYLRASGRRLVEPGHVVLAPPCGTPFQAVCHAVAIDVFYDTSADMIRATYEVAIRELAAAGCRTIAAACLGCGYGRCTIPLFVGVVRDLLPLTFNGVDAVMFASTNRDLTDAIAAAIDAAGN